jgi:hypothetical protein
MDRVMEEHHEKLRADLKRALKHAQQERGQLEWQLVLARNEIDRLSARVAELEDEALRCVSEAHDLAIEVRNEQVAWQSRCSKATAVEDCSECFAPCGGGTVG